ncbi:MAG TPA: hypothetical protein VK927_10315, partial [Adhaeribacter sp.]|nr:hypothetical protein [Adhaeribacter sp.]
MRIFSVKILLLFLMCLSGFAVMAQNGKGKKKDLFKVKPPRIQYVRPDTTILLKYSEFPEDSDAERSVPF